MPDALSVQTSVLSGFEGPEKKLEIDFCNVVGDGFRSLSSEDWQECLNFAKCTIISKTSNEEFDAYVLSESSLFVYRRKIILKTCGTTVLLESIPKILEFSESLGTRVEFVRFSRSNFRFPDEQPFPHSSFAEEVDYLDKFFDGSCYVLGPLNGNRWNVYIADYGPIPYDGEIEQQLEIQMSDLNPEVMQLFFNREGNDNAGEVTTKSGIRDLMPKNSLIDDFLFTPCGYSMNGLYDKAYYTIHITPESHCSYVSFETNLHVSSYNKIIKDVVSTFRPGRVSVTIFADERSPAGDVDTALSLDVDGFALKDRTVSHFQGGYWILSCQFLPYPDCRKIVPEGLKSPCVPRDAAYGERKKVPGQLGPVQRLSFSAGQLEPRVSELFHVERVPPSYDVAEVIRRKIDDDDLDEAFFVIDLGAVLRKHDEWLKLLPRVDPFYAVKCNPNPAIVATLQSVGCGFDCSSKAEIAAALENGVPASQILYANPCKIASQIRFAGSAGVELLTFDNEAELHKIQANHPSAKLLLRIATDLSTTKADAKFGAPVDRAVDLLRLVKNLKLNLVGVCFHVDRPNLPEAYIAALRAAREVFDAADRENLAPLSVLDIGGGFPGTDSDSPSFHEIASAVAPLLDELFPPPVRIIAEPGRFYVSASHTLAVNVFARRVLSVTDGASGEGSTSSSGGAASTSVSSKYMYYINDGVYGSFNCILFDRTRVTPVLLPAAGTPNGANGTTHHMNGDVHDMNGASHVNSTPGVAIYPSAIFGPTCDSLDCVAESVLLPELSVGDWLYFPNMGAYTVAAPTAFNGSHAPRTYYIQSVS